MQKTICAFILAALLSAGCRKSNPAVTNESSPWSIELTDASGSYNLQGVPTFKEIGTDEKVYFDAHSTFFSSSPGVTSGMVISTILDENSNNSTGLKRLTLGIFSSNSTLLQQMSPSSNTDAARLTALQQWLNGATASIGNSNTGLFILRYTDAADRTWQLDPLSTATVTFSDVAPYNLTGYGRCLRATMRFTAGQLAWLSDTLPLTVLGRQDASGTINAFFVLPQ